MLTRLFLYSQFILTGAASALPSLPAFLQIIHFWLYTSSLWQDQVHAHRTSQPAYCRLHGLVVHAWSETGMKQRSKIRHKPFGMNEPSLLRTDPCLLPVIHLANALEIWDESKKLSYFNSHHISDSLCCYTEKNGENSPSCHLFATLLHALFAVQSLFLVFTIYFYYSFVASRFLLWYASVLFLPFSLGKRWREKDEKVKLICFFDKAIKKHVGPSEHFNSLSPFLKFLRGEWKLNAQNCQHIHILFFENWKLRLIIMACTVQLCCWSNQLPSGEALNKSAQ